MPEVHHNRLHWVFKETQMPSRKGLSPYLPMSCWGPERIHTMEGEHQESKGKSCQHLLELNSASLTGPRGIPLGSHHVCGVHVLACLDGPSRKHSGCFRMCWLCTRNRERGLSVLSLRNVLSWWKHGSNTLMLLPFFFWDSGNFTFIEPQKTTWKWKENI